MKPKIPLKTEVRKSLIEEIKRFFWSEKEEEISDLFADMLIDFILNNIGPHIYNKAIGDAYAFISEKADDLFELEKSLR